MSGRRRSSLGIGTSANANSSPVLNERTDMSPALATATFHPSAQSRCAAPSALPSFCSSPRWAPGEEGMTTSDAEAPAPTGEWIVPASAIAFALLFVAGALTAEAVGSTEGKTADQVMKDFHDSKGLVMVSVWVLMLAGLAFVPLAWGATRRVSAGLSALRDYVASTSFVLIAGPVFVGAATGGLLAGRAVPRAN